MLRAETWGRVLKALEELPPATKKVFHMLFIEGKTYSEIAKETGRSKEALRKQKKLGLIMLKGILLFLTLVI